MKKRGRREKMFTNAMIKRKRKETEVLAKIKRRNATSVKVGARKERKDVIAKIIGK